jgi:hypothetical protein
MARLQLLRSWDGGGIHDLPAGIYDLNDPRLAGQGQALLDAHIALPVADIELRPLASPDHPALDGERLYDHHVSVEKNRPVDTAADHEPENWHLERGEAKLVKQIEAAEKRAENTPAKSTKRVVEDDDADDDDVRLSAEKRKELAEARESVARSASKPGPELDVKQDTRKGDAPKSSEKK